MRLDSGWDEAEGAVESLQFEVTSACREVRNSSRSSGLRWPAMSSVSSKDEFFRTAQDPNGLSTSPLLALVCSPPVLRFIPILK